MDKEERREARARESWSRYSKAFKRLRKNPSYAAKQALLSAAEHDQDVQCSVDIE